MKFLLRFFLSLVLIFVVAKPLFMLANGALGIGVLWLDYVEVMWHGLPLDLATAGYLTALPWLGYAVWHLIQGRKDVAQNRPRSIFSGAYILYIGLLAVVLALIFVADACLYAFWDFKLDTTVLAYIDSPRGMASSVTMGYMIGVIAAYVACALAIFGLLWCVRPRFTPLLSRRYGLRVRLPLWIVLGGLLFLAIRGGVGKSTANVGMVYYSPRQFMNHSAVNPAFSFFYSLQHSGRKSVAANFYTDAVCQQHFATLNYNTESVIAPADSLLRVRRPNVLIILMEGCGAQFVASLGGASGITPCLDSLCRTGVCFTQCYANSFRTDRGTVCTLSGYPSFPDVSVMKLPAKSRTLPSIAASLKGVGYRTEFLYGGDKNFTNMNSYLLATGYDRVYGDEDFPSSQRHTHNWGVTDHLVFQRMLSLISAYPKDKPWHTTLLTLASHEPWEVPYSRLKARGRIANAFAYLDHCISDFLAAFRKMPQWENTLVVLLPDHGVTWPNGMSEENTQKYHIPLIFTGGAIRGARQIGSLCNQSDLAATLLGQLGIAHSDFRFSRDVLSQTYTLPCAQHTWSEGFSYIDETGTTIIDLATGRTLVDKPKASAARTARAKAFLQTAYKDLEGR